MKACQRDTEELPMSKAKQVEQQDNAVLDL